MSKELNKAPVEQAGRDERAAFEAWLAQAMSKKFEPEFDLAKYEDSGEYRYSPAAAYWKAWQARAALAQPSQAIAAAPTYQFQSREIGESDWAPCDFRWYLYCSKSPEMDTRVVEVTAQPSPAQAEQAEAERPEMSSERAAYFMRRFKSEEKLLGPNEQAAVDYVLSLIAQHERIVGALRAENAKLSEALDRWPLIRDILKLRLAAAQARVAELEKQEPVAWMHDQPNRVDVIHRDVKELLQRVPGSNRGIQRPLDVSEHYTIPLYAAPVAQAQQLHDLDKQCRDDVARALGLRPSQERGFAWSYLLASIKSCVKASEDAAQAQHSVSDDVERFLDEVRAELVRARSKFPGDRIITIALAEEFGELCKAVLDEPAANVRKEAVQTAVMAARVVLDGDGSVTAWRAERGLDPLAAAPGKEGL